MRFFFVASFHVSFTSKEVYAFPGGRFDCGRTRLDDWPASTYSIGTADPTDSPILCRVYTNDRIDYVAL